MSLSEPESHEALAAAVDELRRETQRLTALGDALGQADRDWTGKFEQLEEIRRRTERSRRKLALRAARQRRRQQHPAETQHRQEVERLQRRLEQHEATELELRESLEVLRTATAGSFELEGAFPRDGTLAMEGAVEELREQLQQTQIRCEELEAQNASLATQLAASRVDGQTTGASSSAMHESLSWEERKAAILQQLHREDADEPLDAGQRESLRDVVAKTDREIQKRDARIAELQQLLEHQSTAVGDSVAVGAAAIAQMIDADDLVREEREKLQAIKAEWQDKLRQAEIDLSLERAKLARERRELEQKHSDLQRQLAEAAELKPDAAAADQPRRRRWLAQLGLSDEE